jgi:hypothetical protein
VEVSTVEYKFDYNLVADMPKLAWLAVIEGHASAICVLHGPSVECRKSWMVEGVWDGIFEHGNFHRSENFFGSGIRIESDKVIFVASSTPIDRLLYCEYNDTLLVSNSLVVLLAATGARLDANHDYHPEIHAVGISRNPYDRRFRINHPDIESFFQVFHENVIYSKDGVSFEYRYKRHGVETYEHYINMLREMLGALRENYASSQRQIPIQAYSTLSQGYDSTAVSSLVRQIGVKKAFSASRLSTTLPFTKTDDEKIGAERIAHKLDLEVISLDNNRSHISEDELYFLATTYPKHHKGAWSEVGLHAMTRYIEANCSAAVVFLGHHGDSIWKVDLPAENIERILIPSRSMGYCSEMRLKSGFISIPLPGFLAADMQDIAAISKSEAMDPWRLYNDYDRPIPRRIAEEAGVDRHLFGMQKQHVATSYMLPINRKLRKAFLRHLKARYNIRATTLYMEYVLKQMLKALPGETEFSLLSQETDLYFLMCHWAFGVLSEKTAVVLSHNMPSIHKA